jgi:hypothetical protein
MDNLSTSHFAVHGYVVAGRVDVSTAAKAVTSALNSLPVLPRSPETAGDWVRAKSRLQKTGAILNLLVPLHRQLAGLLPGFDLVPAGQICSRFPGEAAHETTMGPWHIDNYTPKDASRRRPPRDFDLLVGVFLDDANCGATDAGNLVVYPRSHYQLAHATANSLGDLPGKSAEEIRELVGSDIGLLPPVQIQARAGDVVLLHRMTAHTVAPNFTRRTRTVVYFRLRSAQRPDKHVSDLWGHWKLGAGVCPAPIAKTPWLAQAEREGWCQGAPRAEGVRVFVRGSLPNRFASFVWVRPRPRTVHTQGALSPEMHGWLSAAKLDWTLGLEDIARTVREWDFVALAEEAAGPCAPCAGTAESSFMRVVWEKFSHVSMKGKALSRWLAELGVRHEWGAGASAGASMTVHGPTAKLQLIERRLRCFNWRKIRVTYVAI